MTKAIKSPLRDALDTTEYNRNEAAKQRRAERRNRKLVENAKRREVKRDA